MLGFPAGTNYETKCNVIHGTMGHLDPKQPPTKRKPFASILYHGFVQKTEIILPDELFEIVSKDVLNNYAAPSYSRVILPLSALLEDQFFNEYIKKGNVLMLSEGKVGIDNVYSLKEGTLVLHLDKDSYERAGLIGQPDGAKGKRGTKPWWVVEINLRLPSMLHGKKGFDRIVYAFKNVLTTPVTWLFHDLGKEALTPDPLDVHFPSKKAITAELSNHTKVNSPALKVPKENDTAYWAGFEEYAVEILEWISMALLDSPRLNPNDNINSYLSRYQPPGDLTEQKLVKITWQGFMSSSWAHKTFVKILLAVPRDSWFAYSVSGFAEGWVGGGKSSVILKLPDVSTEYMLWEVA